jgi:hypothetical protein
MTCAVVFAVLINRACRHLDGSGAGCVALANRRDGGAALFQRRKRAICVSRTDAWKYTGTHSTADEGLQYLVNWAGRRHRREVPVRWFSVAGCRAGGLDRDFLPIPTLRLPNPSFAARAKAVTALLLPRLPPAISSIRPYSVGSRRTAHIPPPQLPQLFSARSCDILQPVPADVHHPWRVDPPALAPVTSPAPAHLRPRHSPRHSAASPPLCPLPSEVTMTQLFSSSASTHTNTTEKTDKRTFSGASLSTNKPVNGHVSQRIKNFFRINSSNDSRKLSDEGNHISVPKNEKAGFRQSRFMPHLPRNRSQTIASEGNPLDDTVSPTAHANPYFAHQGPPALRHHNEGSVPSSPTATPSITHTKADGGSGDATTAGKEELARKLRRVASAPNAQGLFASGKSTDRPQTAELGKQPVLHHANSSTLSMVETLPTESNNNLLSAEAGQPIPSPGQIRQAAAFRRTYSSNSIKVRNVEVGPGSFDKIKLIGKGDVGKVYLVREKKSSRLYAMKGTRSDKETLYKTNTIQF